LTKLDQARAELEQAREAAAKAPAALVKKPAAQLDQARAKLAQLKEPRAPSHLQPRTIYITGSPENLHPEKTISVLTRLIGPMNPKPYILLPDSRGTPRIVAEELKRLNTIDINTYRGLEPEPGEETELPNQIYSGLEIVSANWETPTSGTFRKSAGYERNEQCISRSSLVIVFYNGDPKDKGSLHAIKTAEAADVQLIVKRLDNWETEKAGEEAAQLKTAAQKATPAPDCITLDQIHNANQYGNDPRKISARFADYLYIGRGKKYTHWLPSVLANWNYREKDAPPGSTLPLYKADLWRLIDAGDIETLYTLSKITPHTALLCHCKDPEKCHGSVIVAAANWLRTEKGKSKRYSRERVNDIETSRNPAALSKMDPHERYNLLKRVQVIKTTTSKPNPAKAIKPPSNDKGFDRWKPYQPGRQVIYNNGDLTIPMVIVSIDYGQKFTSDPYTGRNRRQILQCELYNAQLKTRLHYSDSENHIGQERREEGKNPHMLPTTSPFIDPRKIAASIPAPIVTNKARIQPGDIAQERDTLTGEIVRVLLITEVRTAAHYKTSPNAPVLYDAYTAKAKDLKTNEKYTWNANGGTELDPV
jgi:hypothetical protein